MPTVISDSKPEYRVSLESGREYVPPRQRLSRTLPRSHHALIESEPGEGTTIHALGPLTTIGPERAEDMQEMRSLLRRSVIVCLLGIGTIEAQERIIEVTRKFWILD